MQYYYSSKKPDARGVIRIHAQQCKNLPGVLGRIYLGLYPNSNLALASVKEKLQVSSAKICKCCADEKILSMN